MVKQIFRTIKWILILAVVCSLAFVIFISMKIAQPMVTGSAEEKIFTVESGTTAREVALDLERERLVSRAWYMDLYLYFKKQRGRIQAGSYLLSGAMSIRDIADRLVSGRVVSDAKRVTVIEGWDVADIGAALEKSGIVSKKDFFGANQKFEGYLYPDTYFISSRQTAQEIGDKMRKNFDIKAGAVARETVILASIVEREVGRNVAPGQKLRAEEVAKLQEERFLVAGVFQNRLDVGMPLQSDATVGYITGSGSNRATLEELEIKSPYNTYLHKGLPPGPIGNPGLNSIRAAQSPAETDYLYFLSAPDGTAYFAKTLREHEINKEKYLK